MKELTKSSRINRALQVIQHTNQGLTVIDACREAGMPRSSYYYIVKSNPDAFIEAQEIIRISNMEQLAAIVVSKVHILERMIQDGLAEETSPRDRVSILREMDRQMDKLMDSLQLDNLYEMKAVDFLKQGPETSKQESKFSAG